MRGYIPQLSPPTVPIQGPSGMSTYHRSTAEQQIQTYGRQQVIYTQAECPTRVASCLGNHRFRKSDIVMLTDDSPDPSKLPTRSNILQAMKWLVRSGKPHDSLFFHYSGHGGQTPDLDGDEIDGFDEVIFPVDHQDKGHITDDTMHDIMASSPRLSQFLAVHMFLLKVKPLPRNCRLTALFDCCHSGTALDLPYIYRTDGRVKKELVTPQARRRKSSPADVISFSGCEDGQTSADTFANGVAVGAMSHVSPNFSALCISQYVHALVMAETLTSSNTDCFTSHSGKNPRQSYQGLLAAVR
ncbi:Metacaspase [Pleurotus pulmonarius]|nr:Metacaspase [Pleurotus pulmonarius]